MARNAEKDREWQRNRAREARTAAINHLGGRCVCCGETHYPYLQLDHDDDGHVHRTRPRSSGYGRYTGGYQLKSHRAILRGEGPRMQVLCANCHQAKTTGLGCNHYGEAGTMR